MICIYTHTHTHEYYSAIKKKEILSLAATLMDLEDVLLSEKKSEKEKKKCSMISFICVIFLDSTYK